MAAISIDRLPDWAFPPEGQSPRPTSTGSPIPLRTRN